MDEDPVGQVLSFLNRERLLLNSLNFAYVREDLREWCHKQRILKPTAPREWALCPDCWAASDLVTLPPTKAGGLPSFYVSCEECGPARLEADELRQWLFDIPCFLETILGEVPRAGTSGSMVADRWWRLGRVRWAGAQWNLHFAREGRLGGGPLPVDLSPRSVVLVPQLPLRGAEMCPEPAAVLPLDQLLIWDGSNLLFDQEFAEDQLAAVRLPDRTSKPKAIPTKAGERQAKIKALERVLTQHVISARDYAVTTRDRTGTAELLKRPTIAWLSKEVGFSGATVWRCLQDAKKERLGQLWELAGDVERILHFHDRCF